jgi:hypothetical protein
MFFVSAANYSHLEFSIFFLLHILQNTVFPKYDFKKIVFSSV